MKLKNGELDFSGPALIMAIVNCNCDSFYAPSRALGEKALSQALVAEEEGAAIVDFGAESSRPGSFYVNTEEEIERLVPVVESFRKRSSLPVSIDTRKAAVAREVLKAGADMINDISALTDDPGMASLCASSGAAVVLMHKKGEPSTMQKFAGYENIALEIGGYLKSAAERALAAGIQKEKIVLDPGIGFGKSLKDNIEILNRLKEICGGDYPLLAGLSRKSLIGEICGGGTAQDASQRLPGTLAANAAAIMGGANIIRVHDVKEHSDLVKVLFALSRGKPKTAG